MGATIIFNIYDSLLHIYEAQRERLRVRLDSFVILKFGLFVVQPDCSSLQLFTRRAVEATLNARCPVQSFLCVVRSKWSWQHFSYLQH